MRHKIPNPIPVAARPGGRPLCAIMAAVLLCLQGCGGQPLEPWHTGNLTLEFTARDADEVGSFDEYRQLEDRLFAQLEEEVYAETGTGPDFVIYRYSSGSAADPRQRNPNWNRSFELTTERPVGGVLLLHGMSDSPYSLRALGETFNRRGYWVVGLRLPGHGTAPSGLKRVRWQDMEAAVKLAMEHLASRTAGKPVHMIGYSTGAPLAVNFALGALEGEVAPVPASLVLVSPAIGVSAAAGLAKWKRRLSYIPGLGRMAWLQIQPEFDPYKYNSFATNAGEQVHRLTRTVSGRVASRSRSNPDNVLPPTLVLKSTVDATVSNQAVVDRLLRRLAPNKHEMVLFDINRVAAGSTILVTDPGPLTKRLMDDDTLPFALTLVTNENPHSVALMAARKEPFTGEPSSTRPLDLAWPRGVISLSHLALPFSPEDPLYGAAPPENRDALFLGDMAFRGERGLLKLPAEWLMRLRHNPFYSFLETSAVDWVAAANGASVASSPGGDPYLSR